MRGRKSHIQRKFSHPILAELMTIRVSQGKTIIEHCEIAGVSPRTVQSMHCKGIGLYTTIEALANALGYELTLTPRPSAPKESK